MNYLKYELYIKGMKCSNCSNKVESVLGEIEGIYSANVNLILEKALVTISDKQNKNIMLEVEKTIEKMGFEVIHVNDLNLTERSYRLMIFDIKEDLKDKKFIADIKGVDKVETSKNYIQVRYDPEIIKGFQLYEKITNSESKIKYMNLFTKSISELNKFESSISTKNLIILVILSLVMMFFSMVDTSFHNYIKSIYIYSHKINLFLVSSLLISLTIIILFGIKLYKRAIHMYINFKFLNMETLITLGSVSSIIYTILQIIRVILSNDSETEMCIMMCVHAAEASSIVISITIIGKYIEEHAKNNIKKYTTEVFNDISLSKANDVLWIKPCNRDFVILENKFVDVGLIEKDDLIEMKENQMLLIDGVIVHGEVVIKENTTYGYDVISKRIKGDKLKSGSIIKSGMCVVMVENVVEDSMLFKLTNEMHMSLNQKLKFQNTIDKVMMYFVPCIIIIAIVTFYVWFIYYVFLKILKENDDKIYDYLTISFVIERSISVLVVSCPCAFGLAIPTVTTIALNLALKHGMLIKNISILPEIRNCEFFVFDKSGTLTEIIREIKVEYDTTENSLPLLEIVSLIEKDQKHPIAEVIYSHCIRNSLTHNSINNLLLSEMKSNGIVANTFYKDNDYTIHIGNYEFICNNKINNIENFSELYNRLNENCLNTCFVCVNKEVKLIFSIDSSSKIRNEASYVIDHLKNNLNKQVSILSGDQISGVIDVGRRLGIDNINCIGDAKTHMKKEFLNNLKKKYKVMMIGDGVNDILSLSEADYGISFNANSQLNLIASDIIFVKKDLRLVISLIKLSKLTFLFIWFNVFWACIYNLCMLPITAGCFHFLWKIDMTPTLSSLSMLCSSLLILLTSYCLKLFTLNDYKKVNETTTKYEKIVGNELNQTMMTI